MAESAVPVVSVPPTIAPETKTATSTEETTTPTAPASTIRAPEPTAQDTTAQKPKVTLYWLEQSRSQRLVWLLQECKGIDFDIVVFKRKNMVAPKELKEIHPLGKSPVIKVEHGGQSRVIAESGFITEYLADSFAQHLVPEKYATGSEGQFGAETETWMRYHTLMHYSEGSLMPYLVMALVFDRKSAIPQCLMWNRNTDPLSSAELRGPRIPFLVRPIAKGIANNVEKALIKPNLDSHFAYLEDLLKTSPGGGKYLCGPQLTAADVMMSFPLIFGQQHFEKQKFPALAAYVKLLEESEGYKASVRKIEEVTGEKFKDSM